MIELQADDLRLVLCPEIGGSVMSLSFRGIDLLRPAPVNVKTLDPRDMAAFPMAPFVGRISDGRFSWGEQEIRLPANMPPEPHAIHGFGWQSPWTLDGVGDCSALIRHSYGGADWPWSYEAIQRFELRPGLVKLSLGLKNTSAAPMPAGLGWHPYFPSPNATLFGSALREATLPSKGAKQSSIANSAVDQLPVGFQVSAFSIDHVFELSEPQLRMEWPTHALTMTADPAIRYATVYSPTDANFFCVEPISHIPGAHELSDPLVGTGLIELQPREEMVLSVRLSIELSNS